MGHKPTFNPAVVESARARISDAMAGLCELYHTFHLGGSCILIDKLPKGCAEATVRNGSKGAVGRHSLTYSGFATTQLSPVGALHAVNA
jgi:hypothetical protein